MVAPGSYEKALAGLRRFLQIIILLALLATGAELLLVGHTEEPWQWVPLVLVASALPTLAWLAAARGQAPVRIWQGLMLLFILSGFVGLGLHWKGKVEFRKESNPSLAGFKLFWEAMQTQSPPTLAPGIMIQTGLLGLVCTYRHPALKSREKESDHTGEDP
jgi:hypothetical protein